LEQDPETLLANELASGGLSFDSGEAPVEAAVVEEEAVVPEQGTVTINGRDAQLGADDRFYYVDDNTPADGISLGMRRGGTVQAFRNGGMASIADLARHYGMRR
jgi:hypothetical protein